MMRNVGRFCFTAREAAMRAKILLFEPTAFDLLFDDIPADGLRNEVLDDLKILYLSKHKTSKEDLRLRFKYPAAIIGDRSRIFVSIPTSLDDSMDHFNVHYLIDTSSSTTTLTR